MIYRLRLSLFLGHKPEENAPSPQSRAESGSLTATALDPSYLSYRSYFTKIQAELSPQKSPTVSDNMSDEKCIGIEACKWMLNRRLDYK